MHINLTYEYLTHHIVPGPQSFSYFVPLVLLPVALLIPRDVLSRWQSIVLFMPIMVLASVHAWIVIDGVDVISVDVLLWAFYLLVLKDPSREFRYVWNGEVRKGNVGSADEQSSVGEIEDHEVVTEEDRLMESYGGVSRTQDSYSNDIQEQPYPSSPKERIPWVLTLLASIRLNNWKIGQQSHDKLQPPPSSAKHTPFVIQSVLSIVRGYLVLDMTRAYISYDPYFIDLNISISSSLPFEELWFIPPKLLRSTVIGAQGWALISQMFYLPCVLAIGLNALGALPDEWSPNTWPHFFGSPRVILLHGVRGFWSQYWHQSMRAFATEPGYATAKLLGLKRGGLLRYAMITISAFGLSGIIHMGLVPPQPLYATIDVNSIRLHVAAFFWVQVIAILVEVVIIRILSIFVSIQYWQQGLGLKVRMLVNVLSFVAWFAVCLPLFGEAARQLGYWRVWPMPISLWRGLRDEGWVTWSFLTQK